MAGVRFIAKCRTWFVLGRSNPRGSLGPMFWSRPASQASCERHRRLTALVAQGIAMAAFGLVIGLIFIFIFFWWNVNDGEWPSGW
jgi:hypothetical protein